MKITDAYSPFNLNLCFLQSTSQDHVRQLSKAVYQHCLHGLDSSQPVTARDTMLIQASP